MNLAAGARGDLSRLVGRLESVRASLRKNLRSELVDEFARIVEALGYVDARALDVAKVPFGRLVAEAIRFSRKLQDAGRANAATLNNTGVLISNNGQPARARPYFVASLKLAPRDATIHENLRIADILMRKSRRSWHAVPDGLRRGKRTLSSYFDPQAM